MRFGITNLIPAAAPPDEWRRFNTAVEAAGFDYVSVGDIQTRTIEMTVNLTLAAVDTSTVRLGPAISNPVTRHPAVMAGTFASLQRLSGGRAWLGISTGNSAVSNIGRRPAKVADLEAYVNAFRELIATGETVYRGDRCVLPWAPQVVPGGVPVYLAANGPNALELAGRIADGVIIGGGLTAEIVKYSLERVAVGAKAANRTLDEIDVWFQAHIAVADTTAEALDMVRDVLAANAARNFRGTLEGKGVPEELESAVKGLIEDYDYSEHATEAGYNGSLLDKYSLTDFCADRWLIGGTSEGVNKRLSRLQAMGVANIHVTGLVPDAFDLVARMGDQIIPRSSRPA